MSHPYQSPVCKGCYALGSACGRCERCDDERAEQARKAEKSDTHEGATLTEWRQGDDGTNMNGLTIDADKIVVTHLNVGPAVQGLPVKGYKKEQPASLVALVNENKILEELVLRQIERHVGFGQALDQRFVALARTKIQEAFMELNRGVFQPERVTDLDGMTALITKLAGGAA